MTERKIPLVMGLGKHSNDRMYSFYFKNPSGWAFEYGWGGRPATYQSEYFVKDMYGRLPVADLNRSAYDETRPQRTSGRARVLI